MKHTIATSVIFSLLLVFLFSHLVAAVAEGSDPLQAEAIDLITRTADKICVTVHTEGNSSLLEVSGEARAELAKVIKSLADIGIEGAAKYRENKYEGLLREDLVEAIKASQDCKRDVFMSLQEKLILPRTGSVDEADKQRDRDAVRDPYNHEWICDITIENDSRQEVAAGELRFGKVTNDARMSYAKVRFTSKRTRILDDEIIFDSGAWTLGYFGKCLEGECMGFVSNKEPHVPVFLVNKVNYDTDGGKIDISGVIMTKKYNKHSHYGVLSGTCKPR